VDGLTADVRELIESAVDSIETLEIVMLLRRSPQTFWADPAVAEQLGIRPDVARTKLQALHQRGILTIGGQTGAYRYAPADVPLRETIDKLADAYGQQRSNVINAIYSANLERLRAFSNAFKVKA
jgi:hypothetical protein